MAALSIVLPSVGEVVSENFRFEINWKITLFSLLFLPILCSLGIWQLSRAQEKQTLLDRWAQQQALKPLDYKKNKTIPEFRRVRLRGVFDKNKYWLLEGQLQKGKLGYHVVMPFNTGEEVILVNRGWIPAGKYREDDPEVTVMSGELTISGMLVSPSDSPMVNDKNEKVEHWPHRILEIDIPLLVKHYGSALAENVLKIDAEDLSAFSVNWRPINMSANKHRAYAAQWFSMAFALAVLWIFANSNLSTILKRK